MMRHKTKNKIFCNKGFILIEIIIYITLFSIIMGGLVTTAYQLSKSTSDLESKVAVQEEINFVSKKIEWAITGASDINVPSADTINITNTNLSPDTIVVRFDTVNNEIEFKKNNILGFSPITTVNVVVDELNFIHIPATGNIPEGVEINFIINGISISSTKYLNI